ncbi:MULTISPECIES: S-layer homology domain-containing protein [unclassified Paenibacillus]|uniref:S-layer homology domain-containing protein n=1 Tax=unclassified Paenibacillus TaxID=185978 RepID=UPI00092FF706|nr:MULTISPECIES: S-layer homology domain-containing protein [unclassified Paenibacillus]
MKLVKKAAPIAVASALLLSCAPHAWASEPVNSATTSSPATGTADAISLPPGKGDAPIVEPTVTREQAIELAKKHITIPEGYTLQSVNLNSYSGDNVPNWSLSYTRKIKEHYYSNINVSIHGLNGKLTAYNAYNADPDQKPSYPPKVDFQGAKSIADGWLKKLNPEETVQYNDQAEKQFRTPLNGNYVYNIRYDRIVDGVPFPQDGISVDVNGEGEVTGYSFRWTDGVDFEKGVTPLGTDKALQAFRDKADIALSYEIPYESRQERKPLIAYRMNTFMIDAAKGEPWSPMNIPVLSSSEKKPITDKPLAEKPAADLNLTKDQAIAKVTSAFGLLKDYKLEDAHYNENTDPATGKTSASWSLRWSLASEKDPLGKGMDNLWASVNAKTGEVTNFNRSMPYMMDAKTSFEPKVTLEDAKAKAIEFVRQQLPAHTHQLVLDDAGLASVPEARLKELRTWDIRFNRVIDGVNANHEGVNISIDRESGQIVNFYGSLSEIAYPATKPEVIGEDKAKDLLFSQYDIQLSYVLVEGFVPYAGGGITEQKYKLMVAAGEIPPGGAAISTKKEAKLVYTLVSKFTREPFFLDAQTGGWRNASTGEPIVLETIKAEDIEGHWAQRELQLMLDYQALDLKDGKVNPNQAMTRGEMIKMLVIAMNGGNYGIYYGAERAASFKDVANGSAYFAYVENGVDRGLIDPGTEFNANATMTREDMAQLIIRALGYKKLAENTGVFNQNFTDAGDVKQVGQAAIVVGLGIMSLTDGSFKPAEEVTRAQAATAFFRYLQKREELQQSPRYY